MCAYAKYRQMFSICIDVTYADGEDMRMPNLCRCMAYGYVQPILFLLFLRSDPKKGKVGSGLINRMEGRTRYARKGVKSKRQVEMKGPL